MKNLFLLILIIVITSCSESNSNNNITSNEIKVETPPLNKKTVDIGILKVDKNGNSKGIKTEVSTLQELVQDDEIDLVEIKWVWDYPAPNEDVDMQITYDKINGNLNRVFVKNNVKEEHSNVFPDCLLDFLKNGEKDFYRLENYCKNAKYDFNNREMSNFAVGEKPKQSELSGSVSIVEKFIESNTNDASSINFLEWSKVSGFGEYWIVRAKYEGKNALGATVTENTWFYIQNNEVVKTKPIN